MKDQLPGLTYQFQNPELLELALTHRSYGPVNNERLEFLGDAILGMVVADVLFKTHSGVSEGALTRLRAAVVRGETLADIATQLNLGEYIQVGSSEKKSGAIRRRSILADTLEAVFAAVYLDGGINEVIRVITELTSKTIANLPAADQLKDPKTQLQEWLQARSREIPEYEMVAESGADHAKEFVVVCKLADNPDISFTASGSSRRRAQQQAAEDMLSHLQSTGSKQ